MVTLVEAANVANGKTLMIRSLSGDIDIIMLIILHKFDEITILIDNGVGKRRKIIDMLTSLSCQQKRKEINICLVFSGKRFVGLTNDKNDEFWDAFSQLGLFNRWMN